MAIPSAPAQGQPFKISLNLVRSSWSLICDARPQTGIWRSMLGISWFWTIGAIWLSFIPPYVADELKADKGVATLFLTIFSLGIGVGSLLCQRLQNGEISAKYVPLAGIGISVSTAVFVLAQQLPCADVFSPLSVKGIAVCASLFGVAVCGGVFSVPLYTILQAWSEASHCSRNIAANNLLNAFFIAIGAGAVALLAWLGMGSCSILMLVAILNLAVSIYIIRIIPESVLHTFFRWSLRALYRVKVYGLENYKLARERKVIIANHVSYLDAVLLTAFLPELPTFAIDTHIAQKWWIRPFLWLVRVYPVNPANPMAIKSLTKLVKEKVPVVIFPEGRLTITGGVMKIYQGPGLMAVRGDADLVPIQLDGVQFSIFSYLGDKTRRRLFPEITITVLPPVRLEKPIGNAKAARAELVTRIYDILTGMAFATARNDHSIFGSLIRAGRLHGMDFTVLNDASFIPLTYKKLLGKCLATGPVLTSGTAPSEAVGILLPNSQAAVVALFGIQSTGRVSALLNFSTGSKNILSACATAKIKLVWTSERFVREAKLQKVVEALSEAGVRVEFMEGLRERLGWREKLRGLLGLAWPEAIWKMSCGHASCNCNGADKPSVILFTSGSSGAPKAVVLSHRNLQSNVRQLLSRIDFHRQDRVFNCLPVFHSFGLTGGMLTPLLGGVRVFMYPSPLHYGIIPELVYQTDSTILFGTNTFLNGYSKKAHPYDFHSLRYVFAGAEKIRESTKKTWAEIFGVRIFEGYGSTECSTVISTNTPMFNQAETVGRFLPGMEHRLESVPGIEAGGRLWVKGPNIMLGYYLPENPGVLVPTPDGWYDTGDIVDISPAGFVKILGRAKRFAKVAGEMVSLAAVEDLAASAWPGFMHAALSVPHPKKGEEVVLITEKAAPKREELLAEAAKQGLPELFVPRALIASKIPVLGSGKPDYVSLQAALTPPAA